jgi:hypothetical protein
MVTSSQEPKLKRHYIWRSTIVALLSIIGILALVNFTIVHWTERQILTTDNWVQVVGPIPKDNTVATALSIYSVNRVFTATDLESRIAEALPDRAAFLAPTLTDQLESRLQKRTKQVIQSDQFHDIWVTANSRAMQRLLDTARNPEKTTESKRPAKFDVDLSSLRETVRNVINQRTGRDVAQIEAPKGKNVGVAVNLKTSIAKVHDYIRLADFLNATLWLLALVCLLGAIALSRRRRQLLLILSTITGVVALLQLIGVKAFRPYVLNQVQDASFRPAVGVVYDTLLASFRSVAISLFVVSVIVFALALLLRKKYWSRSKALAGWSTELQRSTAWRYGIVARKWIYQFRYQLMGAAAAIMLVLVAFVPADLNWRIIIRAVLFTILCIELIYMVGLQTRYSKSATSRT